MSIALLCSVALFGLIRMNSYNSSTDRTVTTEIEFIESQTGLEPRHAVIWLHGLGADGHDFEFIAPQLGIPADTPVRFIFPHAPMRPITVNGGMVMRGWYDIVDLPVDPGQPRREDRQGLEASMQIVEDLIAQENNRGVPTENIILAGFSQGGAIALFTALRIQQKLAGVVAMSTYLPDANTAESENSGINNDTPIFFGHGTQDPLIPVAAAEKSREILEALGYSVHWKTYIMEHSVHPQEIADIGVFLQPLLVR